MSPGKRPPEPWDSFLKDLDSAMSAPVRLDCIGGFLVTQLCGLDRNTADLDVIELAPRDSADAVMTLALRGGPLSRKHLVYIDRVGVAAVPENYEERLIEMFPYCRCFSVNGPDSSCSVGNKVPCITRMNCVNCSKRISFGKRGILF